MLRIDFALESLSVRLVAFLFLNFALVRSPARVYLRRTESLSKAFFFYPRAIVRGSAGGLKRLIERLRAKNRI